MTRAFSLAGVILVSAVALGCSKQDASGGGTSAPAADPSAAAAKSADLKEGDIAPDVEMPLQDGTKLKLSSMKGKAVAIYFYPKDQTPGCTVEAQGIRDTWADLSREGITVIGVSAQDADSHKAFIDKEKLPFNLAIDQDGAIARAFGVPMTMGYHSRQTILVGKDGKVKKIWRKVTPQGHAQEILAAATS
jgi:thioredoxin-dependent peroxiredoxin